MSQRYLDEYIIQQTKSRLAERVHFSVLPKLKALAHGDLATTRKAGPGRWNAGRSLKVDPPSTPIIMTFDPLGLPQSETCVALWQYIVEEAADKKGWSITGTRKPDQRQDGNGNTHSTQHY